MRDASISLAQASEPDRLLVREMLAGSGARPRLAVVNHPRDVVLVEADHPARLGALPARAWLRLHLCLAGGGELVQRGPVGRIEGLCTPGAAWLTLPNHPAEGRWPRMRAATIAVALPRLDAMMGEALAGEPRAGWVRAAGHLHRKPLLSEVIGVLRQEAAARRIDAPLFRHGLVVALHALLSEGGPEREVRQGVRPLSKARLRRVLDRIEAGLGEEISLDELAALSGLGRFHFTRAFRAATGLAPYQYVIARRLEAAARLLHETGLSVAEIADAVGFAEPSQFAASFRRHRGMTPTQWRLAASGRDQAPPDPIGC